MSRHSASGASGKSYGWQRRNEALLSAMVAGKQEAMAEEASLLTTDERADLERLEAVVDVNLKAFVAAGSALLEIRDKRLYRETHGTFEDYCRERWGMSKRNANYLISASEVVDNLGTMVPILPTNERQARPLTQLPAEQQAEAWQRAVETAPDGKVTAAHVQEVVNTFKPEPDEDEQTAWDEDAPYTQAQRPVIPAPTPAPVEPYVRAGGVPAALQMSESNEWYTPAIYVDAARQLMGGIDVDPASNPFANKTVQAATFYTIETDGYSENWHGRVWLNPPYGRSEDNESNQQRWTARLIEQYEAGITSQAVLLVNAVTDRQWFAPLWAYPICFVSNRIRFYNSTTTGGQPTHGSVLVYLGHKRDEFAAIFKQFGPVVMAVVR